MKSNINKLFYALTIPLVVILIVILAMIGVNGVYLGLVYLGMSDTFALPTTSFVVLYVAAVLTIYKELD